MKKELSVVVWSKAGCSYCSEVKQFLENKQIPYQTIDVTHHDDRRDILEAKYGIRHVPVVEIGNGTVYEAVTEIGLRHLEKAMQTYI